MASKKGKINLVYQVESDILQHSKLSKLSFRRDASYFTGRAGIIRILNFILGTGSLACMWQGYYPEKLGKERYEELIRIMKSSQFSGYYASTNTLTSMVLGGCASGITLIFLFLLYFFMEVRCDLLWERVNQKLHVLACVLSIVAAFCDVMSIQEIQELNCGSNKCALDKHGTKRTKYEEEFYPPYFIFHYAAFVGFLSNAMLYSIASRIWLRNED